MNEPSAVTVFFARLPSPFAGFVSMRRLFSVIAAGVAVVFLCAAGQPAPQRLHPAYSDAERAALDKVSAYLNSIHTLKSGFIQLGPDGQMEQGELYLEKPGKVRFA
jgi:outer membrane lipoprotein-sorting protein